MKIHMKLKTAGVIVEILTNVKNAEIIHHVMDATFAIDFIQTSFVEYIIDLYNTVPRCSCQYRIITQERIAELKSNPEKFIN